MKYSEVVCAQHALMVPHFDVGHGISQGLPNGPFVVMISCHLACMLSNHT